LKPPPAEDESRPFVVACVRNEALRLPAFLKHYRRLGIEEFHVIDNDSDDGTAEYLGTQSDVALYTTRQSYAEARCGKDWINEVIEAHGADRWILTVDADELFIFPGFETLPIRGLCRYLDESGKEAMVALMIDMYSSGSIGSVSYSPGDDLIEACPFFDPHSYSAPSEQYLGLPVRGGPRGRLFDFERFPSPFLGKIPLVRWRAGHSYQGSTHRLEGFERARVTGALLHFKFLQDFGPRALIESRREEHWSSATEYKSYQRKLHQDPSLSFYCDRSVRFESSSQLVGLGLMKAPDSYLRRLEELRGSGPDEPSHSSCY
jgi:glycosyltransferase involved in cell wall biosynthesis